ncbi:nuclease HARBI1 [Labeo rohita]|uniref:Nuclease HARBI1 n=2 Tax=Labeo rohita TaxID=84645 RepID=A0A498LY43_LABRO|nr:nuclease HARBI1 [Labeo rohita]
MDYITKIAIITVLYMRRRRRRHRRRHRFWVHPIRRCRGSYGEYHCLVQELRFDEVLFQRYFRLNKTEFDELLARLAPRIAMQNTTFRAAIPPAARLAICLRYLATGDSFTTISYSYRVGVSTVACIVGTVSQAIWECLLDDYMPVPSTQEWSNIAAGFLERWNFPNCVGSIDGKHVVIQAPPNSGSMFYNYKASNMSEIEIEEYSLDIEDPAAPPASIQAASQATSASQDPPTEPAMHSRATAAHTSRRRISPSPPPSRQLRRHHPPPINKSGSP